MQNVSKNLLYKQFWHWGEIKQQLLCNTAELFCIELLLVQTSSTHLGTYRGITRQDGPAGSSCSRQPRHHQEQAAFLQPLGSRQSLPRPGTPGCKGHWRAWRFLHRNAEIIKFRVIGYRISISIGIFLLFSPRPTCFLGPLHPSASACPAQPGLRRTPLVAAQAAQGLSKRERIQNGGDGEQRCDAGVSEVPFQALLVPDANRPPGVSSGKPPCW